MSAVDSMVRTLLRAMEINPDEVKTIVEGRVAAFEANLDLLNDTLLSLDRRAQQAENDLAAICEHLNIERKIIPVPAPTAKKETVNANGLRDIISALPQSGS